MISVISRNWWVLALRGVLAIVFGLMAYALPGITMAVLIFLFAAYALVDGVLAIMAGIRAAASHERWGSLIVEGLFGIAIAIVVTLWPSLSAFAALCLIGFWAIVSGLFLVMTGLRARRVHGEWLIILNGSVSVIFGVLILGAPIEGVLVLLWLLGAYAIAFGVVMLMIAFRLRGHFKAANS